MQEQGTKEDTAMAEETIVVAGGCFWCIEAVYSQLKGILKAESGYCGGRVPDPTYEQVCTGETGHAEGVKITYDPKIITAEDILKIFFTIHNPTTLNQQGPDHGTQYRSAVFFKNPAEKALAQKVIAYFTNENKIWGRQRIVTSLEPLTVFYRAEEYHQNYFDKFSKASAFEKMKMNGGYCQYIIAPKVAKARKEFAAKFKH
jgi:peptide-methionine (S)-S-oxide reductase